MKKSLFRLNPSSISASLLCVVIGLAALIFPQLAINLIFTVLGILLMIIGGILILRYFLQKAFAESDYSLAAGAVFLLVGLILLIAPAGVAAMLQYVFGIVLFLGGALKFQGAFDLKRLGDSKWYICLIFAAVAIGLGFLITRNPFTSELTFMRIIGSSLLVEGLMDGAFTILFDRWFKKFFNTSDDTQA